MDIQYVEPYLVGSHSHSYLYQPVVDGRFTVTEHRLHFNPLTLRRVAITRYIDDEPVPYSPEVVLELIPALPRNNFLLSKLYSPFHFLSRIQSLVLLYSFTGRSSYQQKVLEMGQHIMDLWDWDPPSSSNPISTSVARRSPLPSPIFDSSRATLDHNSFTYSLPTIPSLPLTSMGTPTSTQHSLNLAACVLVNTSPSLIYGKHTMLEFTAPHDLDGNLKDSGSMVLDNMTFFSCNLSSAVTEEDSDSEPGAPYSALSVDSIQEWATSVAEAGEEAKMGCDVLKYDPMVKGTIASHTVNEILMIKGAIIPPTYLQYDDLLALPSLEPHFIYS